MGLWEWITDRLSKDQSQTAHSPGGGKESSPGWGDTEAAVATAEATKELGAKRPDEHEDAWWAPEGGGLVDVPRTERPGLTPEGLALENVLVSHFDGHDLKMPSLLHVAERVLAQLRRRDCDLSAVAREIAQDQVVTAAVLRMANSPLYRGLHKITGLQPALARLGTKAIRTLMLHESIREAMFHGKGELRHFAEILWARSLASAHLMRGLSTFTGLDEEDASLIGLLHDIGGVIVLRIVQTHLVAVQDLIDEATFEYLCAECHQEFGELVADAWKLPASLTKLISDHHSYPAANDPLRMARLQLVLNDMILACLGYMPHVPYALLDSRVVQDLGLADRRGFVAFLAELPGQLEETIEAL